MVTSDSILQPAVFSFLFFFKDYAASTSFSLRASSGVPVARASSTFDDGFVGQKKQSKTLELRAE